MFGIFNHFALLLSHTYQNSYAPTCAWILPILRRPTILSSDSLKIMQFYPHPPPGAAVRPEYGYPATSPRMNWPPAVHPGAWPHYDFSTYSAAYPTVPAGSSGEVRSPSAYNMTSPTGPAPAAHSSDHGGGRRHNIADILGGQSHNLPSEIAKTGGAGYQKSPTSTASGNAMFSPTSATPEHHVRSPTTPTHPQAGRPFEGGILYHHGGAGEVPANFYIPAALSRPLPGAYACAVCMLVRVSLFRGSACRA